MTDERIRTYPKFWKLRLMGGVSRLHNYGYTQSPDKMYIYQVQKLNNDHSGTIWGKSYSIF